MYKCTLISILVFCLYGCGSARGRLTVYGSFPKPAAKTTGGKPVMLEVDYIPRKDWAVLKIEDVHTTPMGNLPPDKITVHHTAEARDDFTVSDPDYMRVIDRFHQKQRGWACIGYHFVIGLDGTIYEGRPLTLQGAHVRSHNPRNIGIALMGNCEQKSPSQAQVDALAASVTALQTYYSIPKDRLYGHRDLGQTVCPGRKLYDIIKKMKSEEN